MATIFQRNLIETLNRKQMTQSELARRSGITQSSISDYINGKYEPKQDKVDRIAAALDISPSFLVGKTGDEPPLDYNRYGLLPVTNRKIPVLGNVHCGDPVYAEEDFLDVVDSDIEADFALRAVGDSMTGVGIEENDLVFVKKQPSVKNGELAVILLNDEEAAIKRVYKYDTYITLNAENPAYAPLVFHEGDSGQVEVLGKVVAHLHYYKERKDSLAN